MREEIAEELDDPCLGKKCTANEHCCDGHVCVDTEDENAENSKSGVECTLQYIASTR